MLAFELQTQKIALQKNKIITLHIFLKSYTRRVMKLKVYLRNWASLVAQIVKNLPAMQEPQVQSLGWEDPLEKGIVK